VSEPATVDIAELLPHAAPMILLDRAVAGDDEHFVAAVTIRPDSPFCDGEQVGAWVGLEYMAQAIAAWAGWKAYRRSQRAKPGLLLGCRRYQSAWPAFPVGTELRVEVVVELEGENGLGSFRCRLEHAQETVASATVTVFQPADIEAFLGS